MAKDKKKKGKKGTPSEKSIKSEKSKSSVCFTNTYCNKLNHLTCLG